MKAIYIELESCGQCPYHRFNDDGDAYCSHTDFWNEKPEIFRVIMRSSFRDGDPPDPVTSFPLWCPLEDV